MNPGDGFKIPRQMSSLNIQQADCSVIQECAVRIIKEGFAEFIDNNGTNRLLT